MTVITHKTKNHKINSNTQTLVIGTFSPNVEENVADFFYGRTRNFLWVLLPRAFNQPSLKGKSKTDKIHFITEHKIDFIDLISEVDVEEVANYNDRYLDDKVLKWNNVIEEIKKLPKLKRVCLTRKSFADIPNMKIRIDAIKLHCESENIKFEYLTTPARFYCLAKQVEWSKFFNLI